MSLSLDLGTKPRLEVQTFECDPGGGNTKIVYLGEYEISLEDFLCMADYVLTNTDLKPNDPRLQFVKCVQSMKKVKGYNPGRERLEASEPAIPPQG